MTGKLRDIAGGGSVKNCGEYFVESYQVSFTGLGARWVVRYHGSCGWCGAQAMMRTPAIFEKKADAVLFSALKNQELAKSANAKPKSRKRPAGGK